MAIIIAGMTSQAGMAPRLFPVLFLLACAAWASAPTAQAPLQGTPEARAAAYLTVEVPRWRREHPCYSCHNNGDATRALLAAAGRGHTVGSTLDDTLTWLATPERWDQNARRGGSEELPLARIQFAGALASMVEAGRADPSALDRAAALVAAHQEVDGAWRLSTTQLLGGATSYGTALATASARRVLARARSDAAKHAVEKADRWLSAVEAGTVLDASSVLLGLEGRTDAAALRQRARCLEVLERGQGPDGGWGPYVTSPSEAFDTALAVLALSSVPDTPATGVYTGDERRGAVQRGRGYLIASQDDDGSWLETTRPTGLESYAQRISTTAWALLALLAS